MNPETTTKLRDLCAQALVDGEDAVVKDLIALIYNQPVPADPLQIAGNVVSIRDEPPLPPEFPPLPLNSAARNYKFWVNAIKQFFLPMARHDQLETFTTPEVIKWVQDSGFPLTHGDMEYSGNHQVFKARIGTALRELADQHEIWKLGFGSRTFSLTEIRPMLTCND